MDIYIFGDLDFAYFILNGITMLYTGDSTFIQAALILSLLFFLWSFIKWGLNPEKTTYPAREWVFGLIFFLIFGGTAISPKFNVNLIHVHSGNLRTIADVPVLAAAPSWLATNLFRTLSNKIETAGPLVNPGYERFRGYGIPDKPSADPLNALVKLNTLANTVLLDRHLETGIQNYIEQCYIPHITFTGNNSLSFTKKNIDDPTIWQDLLVNNPYLFIDTIDQDGQLRNYPCSAYHAVIADGIKTDDSTPGFTQSASRAAKSRDIHPTEVQYATQLIYQNLTGSLGSADPYTIMTNMFLARSIKDSINSTPEASTLQAWSNKMVFEAERKRTFEAAGERSLFMKIYIPTITAIEAFSFFIAPILMMLSVLGGYGFSLIGKYLMLVLFINLWSFIKVFVDIFTALSISQAFRPIGSIPGPDQVANHLAFDVYPQTIAEIESMLTVASNLTAAIPFFAMFLLYGGIHSVMGVMRTVTGGSVDGSNMAPTMATSMNAGTMQMGDQTSTLNTSGGYFYQGNTETSLRGSPNVSLSNVASTSSSFVAGAVTSKSASLTNQFAESVQNTSGFKKMWQDSKAGSNSLNFSEMNTDQRIASLAYGLSKQTGMSQDEAVQSVIQLAAQGGGSVRFGANAVQLFSAGAAAEIKAQLSANSNLATSETIQKNKSALEQWSNSQTDSRTITNADQVATTNTTSINGETGDAYTKTDQAIQGLERNNSISTQLQRMSTNMQNILSNSTLSQSAEPVLAASFGNLINTLKNDYGQYLPAGMDASTLFSEANGFAGNALMNATNQILRHETNANTLDAVSSLWRNAAEQMRDPGNKNSFMTLSRMFEQQGQFLKDQAALSGDTLINPNNPTGNYDTAAQQFAGKYTPPVNNVGEKVNQLEQSTTKAIDGASNVIQAGSSTISKPSYAPQEIKQDINESQVKLDRASKEFEEGRTSRDRAFGLIGSLREGMDNISRAIFGQGVRYGHNAAEHGKIFQASAYNLTDENGRRLTSSRDIGYGMEQLLRYDQANMSNVFSGGTINKDMLAMNDTMRILQSTALDQNGKPIMEDGKPVTVGALYASSIANQEDRDQFLANIGRFDAAKQALPEDQRQLLDTLSELKTNGQITNANANNIAASIQGFNSDSRVERANAPAMARFAEAEVISSKQISPEQSQLIMGELQEAGYNPRFTGEQSTWGGAIKSEYAAATSKISYDTLAEETQIYQQSFAENKIATMLESGNVNIDYKERERIRSQFYANIDVARAVFDKSRDGERAPSEQSVIRAAENDASSAYKAAIKGNAQDMQYVPLMVNAGVYDRAADLIDQRTNRDDGARLNTYVNAFTNSEEGRALFNTPDQLQNFIASGKQIVKD